MRPTLVPASLTWDAQGRPFCPAFGDFYFSQQGGLEESRHVFLGGNSLPRAWEGRASFVVGECGFGSGLNLLALWELFLTCKEPLPALHFVSFERYPLAKEDLVRAHALFPSIAPLAHALHAVYPPLVEGVHTFWLREIKVTLVWDWGEVALEHFPVVDAWFLDGFAPSKNETMWEMTLLQKIANRSKKGTTFATFTAASRVRKGLEEVGFCVQKQQGYGKKREMSTGVLMSPSLCVK